MSQPAPQIVQTPRGVLEYVAEGEGPTALALHGAMGGWDQSRVLTQTVGEPAYRYLSLSRPGYLGTPLASGRSPEEQADLFAAALDVLGTPRAAVMAVSGGGPSALHFALRHPERCWALVLVSTCGARVEGRLPLAFHLLRVLGRWPWFTAAMERKARRDPDRATRASIPDPALRQQTLADPERGPLLRALLSSTAERMGERLPGTLNDVAVTRRYEYPLEQIRVPVLVVHGTADRLVPFARHGQSLATRIPGAQLVTVDGGEHVAIFTHRAQVRPRVIEFLRQSAPDRSVREMPESA